MQLSEIKIDLVSSLCRQYGVKSLRVFGSVARGDSHAGSDLDLLVTFSKPISLLQLVHLERQFSDALGRKVDLVTEKSVSPYLRTRIVKESVPVYAA